MFRDACSLATKFTWPVIISERRRNGQCVASMGAYVLINEEGWFVTAGHILQKFQDLDKQVVANNERITRVAEIRADTALDEKGRRTALKALGREEPTDVVNVSAFCVGHPTATIDTWSTLTSVDFGVGKLKNFVPTPGQIYPVFKNPSLSFDPGTMLCKLGYPFHGFEPTYDDSKRSFILPPGAIPVPTFPLEGMFTRIAAVVNADGTVPSIPSFLVETSSPGLKGQSGGPTFDTRGRIWAIQAQTATYDLGFDTKTPQYLHVGLGVHPTTMFALLDQLKVRYKVSPD
jgi:hypothetical protein